MPQRADDAAVVQTLQKTTQQQAWENDNRRCAMNEAFRWVHVNGREYLQCVPLLERAIHLFSTRQLELPSDHTMRRANLSVFAADLGVEPDSLLRAKQVHGRHVLIFAKGPGDWPGQHEADGLVSAAPRTACAVQVADCVPLLIGGKSVVSAVHAGWRGTAAGVAFEAVRAITRLGADPSTLVAALGPAIGPCCYQVDTRVRDAFAQSSHSQMAEEGFTPDGEGHWRLDVSLINRRILEAAGIPRSQIHDSRLCTACDRGRFYSYRAEGPGTGRLIAGIAVP